MPDLKAGRFPEWRLAALQRSAIAPGDVTLTGLLTGWWKEAEAAGQKPSTYQSYRNTMDSFVGFCGMTMRNA